MWQLGSIMGRSIILFIIRLSLEFPRRSDATFRHYFLAGEKIYTSKHLQVIIMN